jgi:hypothetical protein
MKKDLFRYILQGGDVSALSSSDNQCLPKQGKRLNAEI